MTILPNRLVVLNFRTLPLAVNAVDSRLASQLMMGRKDKAARAGKPDESAFLAHAFRSVAIRRCPFQLWPRRRTYQPSSRAS